jgi:NAD-dependent dihydropyrimidine dehydrogenase PreA subunit
MHEILSDITEGKGQEEDIATLLELGNAVKDTSLCGLGQTASNPMLSTLRYFQDEYLAHIRDKKCPAGVCKTLIEYTISPEACTGCGLCRKNCPEDAIAGEAKKVHSINKDKCIKCGICREVCKFDAVIVN